MQGNGARKGHTRLTNQTHQGERDEFTKPKSNMELSIEDWLSQERRWIEPARIATDLLSPGAWTAAKWWRQCNPSPPGDVTSQGRWLSWSVSCYEVYSCPHATIPTSFPSTISWCKSSPLYSSRTTPQFFVKSNHSQKPQASLRNTRAITHTHISDAGFKGSCLRVQPLPRSMQHITTMATTRIPHKQVIQRIEEI